MGCDIHCVIEYRRPSLGSDYLGLGWTSYGYSSFNPGRSYNWFSELAGVRGYPKGKPLATGFGLPDDVSYTVTYETTLTICDDPKEAFYDSRKVTPEQAETWVKAGISKYVPTTAINANAPRKITNPDYHTYGWCNPEDWKKSTRGRKWLELKCMNAVINTIVKEKCEVRVVFWFDN